MFEIKLEKYVSKLIFIEFLLKQAKILISISEILDFMSKKIILIKNYYKLLRVGLTSQIIVPLTQMR